MTSPDSPTAETPTDSGASDTPAHRYTSGLAGDIEQRWQDRWESEGTFETPNPVGDLADGHAETELPAEKYFLMDMFPYPSGAGLHVGHPWATSPPTSPAATSA